MLRRQLAVTEHALIEGQDVKKVDVGRTRTDSLRRFPIRKPMR
jgi:hypothetical protein